VRFVILRVLCVINSFDKLRQRVVNHRYALRERASALRPRASAVIFTPLRDANPVAAEPPKVGALNPPTTNRPPQNIHTPFRTAAEALAISFDN
jgi:hypothetical protein